MQGGDGGAAHAGQVQGAVDGALAHPIGRGLSGEGDGVAGHPLGERRAGEAAERLQALAEEGGRVEQALDVGGTEHRAGLEVDRADHLAVHPKGDAHLGAQSGDRSEELLGQRDVLDHHRLPGGHDATDDAGGQRKAVEHLEVAARGLAPQAPADHEVHRQELGIGGKVVDEGDTGVPHRRRS